MSTPIVRRRKKAVEVDTIQWLGDNEADVRAFTGVGHFQAVGDDDRNEDPDITAVVWDRLHSTWVGVKTGQHIVRGVKNGLYPIAEDVLTETYEECPPAGEFFEPGHTYLRFVGDRELYFRATYGRPCYIKRNTVHAALIVPTLTDGPEGPYSYLKTFQRATIHEAVTLGFVTLGAHLVDVPEFGAVSHWSMEPALQGRTISLRGAR